MIRIRAIISMVTMMITIYKITNRLNWKIYVGQTHQSIEKRFLQHSKTNSPLGQAMSQCGLENFTIEIIEECATQEQANERERFWIKVLNCKMPNGYNRSSGGEGGIHKPRNISLNKEQGAMAIGERITGLRESRDVLQKELARAIDVDPVVLNRIEKGKRSARGEELKAIADYFNVTTDYLLGREMPKSPALSDEQTIVLKGFDSLNLAGRNLLVGVLDSLRVSHSAAV